MIFAQEGIRPSTIRHPASWFQAPSFAGGRHRVGLPDLFGQRSLRVRIPSCSENKKTSLRMS